ncbi:hypothetical protein BU24DRAFT_229016 [Aaosphaeria arxii CBS 175.79]|uniref:Uncharacterized protein n=1 Tax=Aaosphaeria arxii CBS 175.79 TaxID=1450172 RepID=A0A6A5XR21_9PLEO|nr:uncharacterized protein BU24DRAFT_229016 [Aaosphaeria arxii CBS 175.79]KAF2015150.1 hypothetical protein BU24DRAFT_229016 [Aaosphaeria arxii CBS 175.79]
MYSRLKLVLSSSFAFPTAHFLYLSELHSFFLPDLPPSLGGNEKDASACGDVHHFEPLYFWPDHGRSISHSAHTRWKAQYPHGKGSH